jgi:hypothetical protein
MPYWPMFTSADLWVEGNAYKPDRWLGAASTIPASPAAGTCPETGLHGSGGDGSGCPYLRSLASGGGGGGVGAQAASTAAPAGVPLGAAMTRLVDATNAALGLERVAAPGTRLPVGPAGGQAPVEPTLQGGVADAFQPFGVGNRSCPGRALAMMQIRLMTVKMLSKYRLESGPSGSKLGDSYDLSPKLRLVPRSGRSTEPA